MKKPITYFLAVRDKIKNTVKFISVSGGWGDSLEDIDLFTTKYDSSEELIKYLYEIGEIKSKSVDLFIVNGTKNKDEFGINTQEILYSDSKIIQKVAWGFKNKNLAECNKEIESILNKFCYLMENNPDFNDFVLYDETNVYDKFINYFTDSKYNSCYDVKYKDGIWAKKSYTLLRNVCETISRYSKNNVNYQNLVDRNKVKGELLRLTNKDYDENQLSFFDMEYDTTTSDDNKTDEEKLLEVMNTIENLDGDTIIENDEEIVINKNKFYITDESDKEKYLNLLNQEIICLISHYKMYMSKMNEINFDENYKYYYDDLINTCRKSIIYGLEDKGILNNTYLWCLLYNEYNAKKLGDRNGYEYRKDQY